MKVVLDTNILISGLKDEYSYEKRIIDEVIDGSIEAYANRETLDENKLIIRQLIDNPDYEQDLRNFFAQVNRVSNRHNIHIVRDEEDNKILESAVEAGAEFLITRDNDLLELVEFQGVEIVSPQAFWAKYKDEGMDQWKAWTQFVTKK